MGGRTSRKKLNVPSGRKVCADELVGAARGRSFLSVVERVRSDPQHSSALAREANSQRLGDDQWRVDQGTGKAQIDTTERYGRSLPYLEAGSEASRISDVAMESADQRSYGSYPHVLNRGRPPRVRTAKLCKVIEHPEARKLGSHAVSNARPC